MASTANPPALSLPAQTFAKLSPGPFLLAHLRPTSANAPSLRPSGRKPSEHRPISVNTSSLTHCNGSAVVRVGDTAVVCGVRGEILLARDVPYPPMTRDVAVDRGGDNDGGVVIDAAGEKQRENEDAEEMAELGLLVPNLELSTGCSPAHLPGNPPGTLAQSLSQRILSTLHVGKVVDLRDLRIWYQRPRVEGDDADEITDEVKAYWTLYIDILFISLDGNAFDAAWGAVMAALRDVKLPKAWWDADREMILCSDELAEAKTLSLRGFPVACSYAVFEDPTGEDHAEGAEGAWVLADPDMFEKELCNEVLTVVLDCSSGKRKLFKIEKTGGGVIDGNLLRDIVEAAAGRWQEWKEVVNISSR